MHIRIRPPLSSCDCKPPRTKKQEDKTSVTLMYLGIESLAYWSRAADENFSFAAVWWIHAASSCLDLYDRSETHVQEMCLMPDKTQSESDEYEECAFCQKKLNQNPDVSFVSEEQEGYNSLTTSHYWRANVFHICVYCQILEQKTSKKGVTWYPSIFFERTFLLWHLQVGCIFPPNIVANQTLRPVNSINHRSNEKPTVELQRHLHQSRYFHHASSCCHIMSFELVEYYCGCMSDLHTSSWLMFAASRFQSLRLWSNLQDTIASHRPLPAGWNPRLYWNQNSLKILPPCIQPIDQA